MYEFRSEYDNRWWSFVPLTIVPEQFSWNAAPDGWAYTQHHDGRRWWVYRRQLGTTVFS